MSYPQQTTNKSDNKPGAAGADLSFLGTLPPLTTPKVLASLANTDDASSLAGLDFLAGSVPEKYLAREGVSSLAHAFPGKIAVHPGMSGSRLDAEQAHSVLDTLLDETRQGTSVAYIHVPFCQTHCLYCGFYNKAYKKEESSVYATALLAEMKQWRGRRALENGPVHAVYLGGGTPTALEAEDLQRILLGVREILPLANDCEITVEGRLTHFDESKMEACLAGGANRFSLGVQSFNTAIRRSMGRVVSGEEAARQLQKLLSYNQAAVIVDLIYGFPNQSMDVWQEDLSIAQSLGLDGADCYQLNVYRHTPLGKGIEKGEIVPAADIPMQSAMFAMAVDSMDKAFFHRVSMSHWARTSRERNLYNLYVKGNAHCLAFGPGAGGNLQGNFYINNSDYAAWLEAVGQGRKPIVMMQSRHHWHGLFKTMAVALEQGWVDFAALEKMFGLPLFALCQPLLRQWQRAGLLDLRGHTMVLTVAGQFWHVTVSQLLLDYMKHGLDVIFKGEEKENAA